MRAGLWSAALALLPTVGRAQNRDAQVELATYGAIYGASLGIWSSFELDLSPRPGAWLSLGTTGGLLYGGYQVADLLDLSEAQVRLTGVSAGWLTLDFLLLMGEAGLLSEDVVWLAFATAAVGGGAALLAASQGFDPSEGDLSLVNSGGLWMVPAGLLFGFTTHLGSGEHLPRDVLLLNLLGLGLGVGLAHAYDPSREQVLYLDLGLLAGGLGGALVGVIFGVLADSFEVSTTLTLFGMAGGAWVALEQAGFDGGKAERARKAEAGSSLSFSVPLWAGTW